MEKKKTKEKFYAANVRKTNSQYLTGYLEKVIRPLVLILPNDSGYIKTLKLRIEIKIKKQCFLV